MYENVSGGAKRVLAIGVSLDDPSMSPLGALAPDGMLIVIDGDPVRAERARRAVSTAGLAGRAAVIGGDPARMVYKLAGPFDVIFCGPAYRSTRGALERLLAPTGVLITNDGA